MYYVNPNVLCANSQGDGEYARMRIPTKAMTGRPTDTDLYLMFWVKFIEQLMTV